MNWLLRRHGGGLLLSSWFWLHYQVGYQILGVGLFSSINNIFWKGKTSYTGPSNHTVMSWRGVGHLHGRKLEETLAQRHTTQQQLPVTAIAAPVLMLGAASAPSYAIHILVRLAGVLSKVNPCSKHPSYVGMALVKTLLCYGLNER